MNKLRMGPAEGITRRDLEIQERIREYPSSVGILARVPPEELYYIRMGLQYGVIPGDDEIAGCFLLRLGSYSGGINVAQTQDGRRALAKIVGDNALWKVLPVGKWWETNRQAVEGGTVTLMRDDVLLVMRQDWDLNIYSTAIKQLLGINEVLRDRLSTVSARIGLISHRCNGLLQMLRTFNQITGNRDYEQMSDMYLMGTDGHTLEWVEGESCWVMDEVLKIRLLEDGGSLEVVRVDPRDVMGTEDELHIGPTNVQFISQEKDRELDLGGGKCTVRGMREELSLSL